MNTRGKCSFLMHIHGYVLSSFRRILYLGWCFFIRLFSSSRASDSLSTTTCLRSEARESITWVLPDWFLLKYDDTLFLRLRALPTYSRLPAASINWYTPGLSGSVETVDHMSLLPFTKCNYRANLGIKAISQQLNKQDRALIKCPRLIGAGSVGIFSEETDCRAGKKQAADSRLVFRQIAAHA